MPEFEVGRQNFLASWGRIKNIHQYMSWACQNEPAKGIVNDVEAEHPQPNWSPYHAVATPNSFNGMSVRQISQAQAGSSNEGLLLSLSVTVSELSSLTVDVDEKFHPIVD